MRAKAVSFETVRELALSLPDVTASTMYGSPAVKRKGTLLATMATNRSAEPDTLVVRVSVAERDELIAADPDTYYLTEHYLDWPTVLVRLSRVHVDALRDLLLMSWRFAAASPTARRRRLT